MYFTKTGPPFKPEQVIVCSKTLAVGTYLEDLFSIMFL